MTSPQDLPTHYALDTVDQARKTMLVSHNLFTCLKAFAKRLSSLKVIRTMVK